jgi:competence protein ComEC
LRRISEHAVFGPWTVIYPRPDDQFAQADDNTLVLLGKFPAARVLLVSDLGRPGQRALLDRSHDLRADIVVTGLPSASEALGDDFLEAVQPRVIIVADSEYPSMERARPELRERLAKRGVPVIYTRSSGAVTAELRGKHCELRAMDGTRVSM